MIFPKPFEEGNCMIPPYNLTFDKYNPLIHGPLIPCPYKTAKYPKILSWWMYK